MADVWSTTSYLDDEVEVFGGLQIAGIVPPEVGGFGLDVCQEEDHSLDPLRVGEGGKPDLLNVLDIGHLIEAL